jgi:hypothetical protein
MGDHGSSVGDMTDSRQETTGMRVMFWTWFVLIFGGLAVMIALPLLGR